MAPNVFTVPTQIGGLIHCMVWSTSQFLKKGGGGEEREEEREEEEGEEEEAEERKKNTKYYSKNEGPRHQKGMAIRPGKQVESTGFVHGSSVHFLHLYYKERSIPHNMSK